MRDDRGGAQPALPERESFEALLAAGGTLEAAL
jgi:hypothetical protein